ncbi:MAG: lipoate--protein ligase family protein [Verrucomicrobiae bacterium]|nr:lipoate--protein ligase family protein [Verrucomicrobiae bacterium]
MENSMILLDLTLPTPAENLACDEALLNLCESGGIGDVLRFWEPKCVFVVIGYSNRAAVEVNLAACRSDGVPVLRRITGGGAVLQAPGCLNYSLILQFDRWDLPRGINHANALVLERHRTIVERLLRTPVERRGLTDLAVFGRKISGNAQRQRSSALLYHGTFLINAPIELMARYLPMPSKTPDYRAGRSHDEFVINTGLDPSLLKLEMARAWGAKHSTQQWPHAETEILVRTKYSLDTWNFRL